MKFLLTYILLILVLSSEPILTNIFIEDESRKDTRFSLSKVNENLNLNGYYYGTSMENNSQIGWLLKLDFINRKGVLYNPTKVLKLFDVKIDKNKKVTFQSEDDAGVIIKYQGEFSRSSLKGRFITYREINGVSELMFQHKVLLELVNTQLNNICTESVYCGRFSNVKYNPDSGDLNGSELCILPTMSGSYKAVFTDHAEGELLTNVDNLIINKSSISFTIKRKDGIVAYRGYLTKKGLTFNVFRSWSKNQKEVLTLSTIVSLDKLLNISKS